MEKYWEPIIELYYTHPCFRKEIKLSILSYKSSFDSADGGAIRKTWKTLQSDPIHCDRLTTMRKSLLNTRYTTERFPSSIDDRAWKVCGVWHSRTQDCLIWNPTARELWEIMHFSGQKNSVKENIVTKLALREVSMLVFPIKLQSFFSRYW